MSEDEIKAVQKLKLNNADNAFAKEEKAEETPAEKSDVSLFGDEVEHAFEDLSDAVSIHEQSKALHKAVQKGFQGTASYDFDFGFDTSKAKSKVGTSEYTQMLDNIIKNNSKLPKEELEKLFKEISGMDIATYKKQKKDGTLLFDIERLSATSANYASQIAKFGETALGTQAKKTTQGQTENLDKTKQTFQQVLDSEGLISDMMNGVISLFGTSRGDVKDAIAKEEKNIAELKELASKMPVIGLEGKNGIQEVNLPKSDNVKAFIEKYKQITGVQFKIENFEKLSKVQTEYATAIFAQNLQDAAKQLKTDENWYNSKHNYNLESFKPPERPVMMSTAEYKRLQLSKPKKDYYENGVPSPLEKALLKQYNGNKKMGLAWIQQRTQALNLEGLSQKERYKALVQDFINSADTLSSVVFKDKDFETISQEYKMALTDAYGKNIPQEKLENYIENQAVAKGVLQTAVILGVGMMSGGSALAAALAAGGLTGLEKTTDANGLTNQEVGSILAEMGITYASFKLFAAVANKVTPAVRNQLFENMGINKQLAGRIGQLTGTAAGGMATSATHRFVAGVAQGEELTTALKEATEEGLYGGLIAIGFSLVGEAVHEIKNKITEARYEKLSPNEKAKYDYNNLLKTLKNNQGIDEEAEILLKSIKGQENSPESLNKVLKYFEKSMKNWYFEAKDVDIVDIGAKNQPLESTALIKGNGTEVTGTHKQGAFEYKYPNQQTDSTRLIDKTAKSPTQPGPDLALGVRLTPAERELLYSYSRFQHSLLNMLKTQLKALDAPPINTEGYYTMPSEQRLPALTYNGTPSKADIIEGFNKACPPIRLIPPKDALSIGADLKAQIKARLAELRPDINFAEFEKYTLEQLEKIEKLALANKNGKYTFDNKEVKMGATSDEETLDSLIKYSAAHGPKVTTQPSQAEIQPELEASVSPAQVTKVETPKPTVKSAQGSVSKSTLSGQQGQTRTRTKTRVMEYEVPQDKPDVPVKSKQNEPTSKNLTNSQDSKPKVKPLDMPKPDAPKNTDWKVAALLPQMPVKQEEPIAEPKPVLEKAEDVSLKTQEIIDNLKKDNLIISHHIPIIQKLAEHPEGLKAIEKIAETKDSSLIFDFIINSKDLTPIQQEQYLKLYALDCFYKKSESSNTYATRLFERINDFYQLEPEKFDILYSALQNIDASSLSNLQYNMKHRYHVDISSKDARNFFNNSQLQKLFAEKKVSICVISESFDISEDNFKKLLDILENNSFKNCQVANLDKTEFKREFNFKLLTADGKEQYFAFDSDFSQFALLEKSQDNLPVLKAIKTDKDGKTTISVCDLSLQNMPIEQITKSSTASDFYTQISEKYSADKFDTSDLQSIYGILSEPEKYGKLIFKAANPTEIGNAEFSLPEGENSIKHSGKTEFVQLDTTKRPNFNAERITVKYPDGRIAINDWHLDTSTVIEPLENGVHIKRYVGSDVIDLSSDVTPETITIKDNMTGKSLEISMAEIISRDKLVFPFAVPDEALESEEYQVYTGEERKEKIIELFKKLSPTTILNICKFMQTYPDAQLPYLKQGMYSICSPYEDAPMITLSDNPHIVSHEALHGITAINEFIDDKELLLLHEKDAEKIKGNLQDLSFYAKNTQGVDGREQKPIIGNEKSREKDQATFNKLQAKAGVNELISILGTYDEYGLELKNRADGTRLAFGDVGKKVEEKLMTHYQNLLYDWGLSDKKPSNTLDKPAQTSTQTGVSRLLPTMEQPVQEISKEQLDSQRKELEALISPDKKPRLDKEDVETLAQIKDPKIFNRVMVLLKLHDTIGNSFVHPLDVEKYAQDPDTFEKLWKLSSFEKQYQGYAISPEFGIELISNPKIYDKFIEIASDENDRYAVDMAIEITSYMIRHPKKAELVLELLDRKLWLTDKKMFWHWQVLEIVQIDDIDQQQRAMELALYKTSWGTPFLQNGDLEYYSYPKERTDLAIKLLDIKDSSGFSVIESGKLKKIIKNPELCKKFYEYMAMKDDDGEDLMSKYTALELLDIKDEAQIQRALDLMRQKSCPSGDCLEYAKIKDPEILQRTLTLAKFKDHGDRNVFGSIEIEKILSDKTKCEKIIEIMTALNRVDDFGARDVYNARALINKNSEKLDKIIRLLDFRDKDGKPFITSLGKLISIVDSDENMTFLLKLLNITDSEGFPVISRKDISLWMTYDDAMLERANKLLSLRSSDNTELNPYLVIQIAESEKATQRILSLNNTDIIDIANKISSNDYFDFVSCLKKEEVFKILQEYLQLGTDRISIETALRFARQQITPETIKPLLEAKKANGEYLFSVKNIDNLKTSFISQDDARMGVGVMLINIKGHEDKVDFICENAKNIFIFGYENFIKMGKYKFWSDAEGSKKTMRDYVHIFVAENTWIYAKVMQHPEEARARAFAETVYNGLAQHIDYKLLDKIDQSDLSQEIKVIIANQSAKDNNLGAKLFELASQLTNDKTFPPRYIALCLHSKDMTTILSKIDFVRQYIKSGKPIVPDINFIKNSNKYDRNSLERAIDNSFFNIDYYLSKLSEEKTAELNTNFEDIKQKCLTHPELYVNDESPEEYEKAITEFLKINEFIIKLLSDLIGTDAIDDILRTRFEDAQELFHKIRNFNFKDFNLLRHFAHSKKIDGKSFISTERAGMIDMLIAYKYANLSTVKMRNMIKNNCVNMDELNLDLLHGLFKLAGLPQEEISQIPPEKIASWHLKFMPDLAKELAEMETISFADLFRATNLDDFNRYIHDSKNSYGAGNAKTQEVFKEMGFDYQAWLHPDKSLDTTFKTKDKVHDKLEQISEQIIEDIETLRQLPAKSVIDKTFSKCIKDDKFVIPSNILGNKEKLINFVNNLLTQLNKLWKRAKMNSQNGNPEISQNARNVLTVQDHLKQRISDIEGVRKTSGEKAINWRITMWDRVPQKDLFQGNFSTCCIGMGRGNGQYMPEYLMNTMFNMIEVIDEKTGKTVANALCYYAKNEEGKPVFVADNIEINNHAKPATEVCGEFRKPLVEFIRNLNSAVANDPNMPIYLGDHYNDVPDDDLPKLTQHMVAIGDMKQNKVYADLFHGELKKGESQKAYALDMGSILPPREVPKAITKEEFISKIQSYGHDIHYEVYLDECLDAKTQTVREDIVQMIERNFAMGIFSEEMTKNTIIAYKSNPKLVTECQEIGIHSSYYVVQADQISPEITRILLDSDEKDGYNIKRIVETAKDNPEMLKKCLDMGIKDSYKIEYIIQSAQINPELVQQCFNMGINDAYDIKSIVESAQINSELVQQCFNMGIKKTYDIKNIIEATEMNSELVQECFNIGFKKGNEIKHIIESAQINPELVRQCFDMNIKDYYQIAHIVQSAQINPELVQQCFDIDIKEGNQIEYIVEAAQINSELVQQCFSRGIKDGYDIKRIVDIKNPEFVQKCFTIGIDRSYEIEVIAKSAQKNPKLVQKCFAMGIRDYHHIEKIVTSASVNPELVQKCFDMDIKNGDEINNIVESAVRNPELVQQCFDIGIKNGYEIKNIVEATQINPELVQKCFNMGIKEGHGIKAIVESAQKNPELVQKCFDLGNRDGLGISAMVETASANPEFVKKCLDNGITDGWAVLYMFQSAEQKPELVQKCFDMCKNKELTPNAIVPLIVKEFHINYKDYKLLVKKLGKEFVGKLSQDNLITACNLVGLCKVNNINEIKLSEKKSLLRGLVASNTGLFKISEELRQHFPLLPKNQEEYCSLLPQIVKSLGIETRVLKPEEKISDFNNSMSSLGQTLSRLSTQDFADLQITQDFSKDEFIRTVIEKTKVLSNTERQKVFDYFGFELHHNKAAATGYSITGYPVNLNNGKKLAQIDNEQTKAVVENLRPDIIRFSEQKVKVNNPQVEKLLNDILAVLPEMQGMIGRTQHGTHQFDVMKHSLKVMQKISQDINFLKLNETDKKIMLLASLLHDITKLEGFRDKTHATESSFDTFFIAKKFKLSKEEEIKLYNLIKHHEWLGYTNSSKDEKQLTRRLQSVAFDLQQDNLFDMALIFTHADLRAVKTDDSFHDITGYGAIAEQHAEKIKEYIAELKTTQPLLPVTKLPKAESIRAKVTQVNPDGSTNIKGVYVDKDGLVVVKYNEVESWEDLGFPKGTISRGISATGVSGRSKKESYVDTGNIKFFVHALDYSNQLAKFDAFSLVDSDVLLSVSYAERPESKYRFFRTQGVLLDVDTKYVYGGGDTDSGSGCGKNIQEFKNNYIFGGERESDRTYVANLIKEATGMSTEEYVKFVETNKNKSMLEIEPAEIREKIIQAFATINSNVRKGEREYNEMYASNPNVMGVFTYAPVGKVGNPLEYLPTHADRLGFLKQYALEKGLPFIVFGE